MKNTLFWRKYRPKNLDELILLPRIRESLANGISNNFIFYGSYGCGKSSLCEILSMQYPTFKINASLYTSIDLLRDKCKNFIDKMDLMDLDKNLEYKIIFLDEFERLSAQALDALKGFIEDNDKGVRFIATTNHLHKVPEGIASRFTKIPFDTQNQDEVTYLKEEYFKYVSNINSLEELNIDVKGLKSIINSNFPDLRQVCNVLQDIKTTGKFSTNVSTNNAELSKSVLSCILKKGSADEMYSLSMEFEHDIYQLFKILGRPFIEGLFKYSNGLHKDKVDDITILVTKYAYMFNEKLDPVIHAYALMAEVKKLF